MHWSKSLKFQGYTLFELTLNAALLQKATQYVYERIESGKFLPRIDRTLTLSNCQRSPLHGGEPADRKDRRHGVSRTDSDWHRLACLGYLASLRGIQSVFMPLSTLPTL
jgi:hypothetical protein